MVQLNISEGRAVDRDKAALLFQLRRLIGRKYEIDHDDLLDRLEAESAVSPGQLEALRPAREGDDFEAARRVAPRSPVTLTPAWLGT